MKKAIYLILCMLWVVAAAQAQGIRFIKVKTLQEALVLAKAENKYVFLDAYASWCGPCKYLQQKVFTDNSVGSLYNQKFISVSFDMEENGEGTKLSKRFNVAAYPTLLFFNSKGELVHEHVGAMESEDFVALGNDAVNPEKQFFLLFKKARSGKLATEHLAPFISDMENIMSDSVDDVIKSYIRSTSYSFLNKDVLQVVLDKEKCLDEQQLKVLYSNKSKVMEITGKNEEEINKVYLGKVLTYAITRSYKEDSINFDSLRSIISQYEPTKAEREVKIVRTRYKLNKGELEFSEVHASNDEDVLETGGVYYYENSKKDKQILNQAKQIFVRLSSIGSQGRMETCLEYLIAINKKLNQMEEFNYFGRAERIKENISFRERLFNMDPANSKDTAKVENLKILNSNDYGSLSFYQVFLKEFDSCIISAKKGIDLYPRNDWIYTNLALAYLMTRRFSSADSIYSKYKGRLYSDGSRAFKEAFVADLDKLEVEGIISISDPEIYNKAGAIKAFLKK